MNTKKKKKKLGTEPTVTKRKDVPITKKDDELFALVILPAGSESAETFSWRR